MTFQPGQSGNPSGRPKGIADKRVELRNMLEPHAKEIIDKLIECAKVGDVAALRLCIERLIPRAKADDGIKFELPDGRIDTGDNMLEIANRITEAVASGQLTIEEAEKFNDFLRHQRQLIENAERKKRDEVREAEWKSKWAKTNDNAE